MDELLRRGPQNKMEELRIEIFEKVNALGTGAQGLGGLTTVLDIRIKDYPLPRCRQTSGYDSKLCGNSSRTLPVRDGSGVAHIQAPKLKDYQEVTLDSSKSRTSRFRQHCPRRNETTWQHGRHIVVIQRVQSTQVVTLRIKTHGRHDQQW